LASFFVFSHTFGGFTPDTALAEGRAMFLLRFCLISVHRKIALHRLATGDISNSKELGFGNVKQANITVQILRFYCKAVEHVLR